MCQIDTYSVLNKFSLTWKRALPDFSTNGGVMCSDVCFTWKSNEAICSSVICKYALNLTKSPGFLMILSSLFLEIFNILS